MAESKPVRALVGEEPPGVEAGWIDIAKLKPHPRNYVTHPAGQIEHLAESIREYGFVRNIVIANDDTILAGHGAVEAAQTIGYKSVPYMRVDHDPDHPKAIKFLALENELRLFAERDDRGLSELLREISQADTLLGTGYDEHMLAALVMVTRPEHEVASIDAAAEWVGMPEFEPSSPGLTFVVHFDNEEDRERFLAETKIVITRKERGTTAGWWPPRDRDDKASVMFTDE